MNESRPIAGKESYKKIQRVMPSVFRRKTVISDATLLFLLFFSYMLQKCLVHATAGNNNHQYIQSVVAPLYHTATTITPSFAPTPTAITESPLSSIKKKGSKVRKATTKKKRKQQKLPIRSKGTNSTNPTNAQVNATKKKKNKRIKRKIIPHLQEKESSITAMKMNDNDKNKQPFPKLVTKKTKKQRPIKGSKLVPQNIEPNAVASGRIMVKTKRKKKKREVNVLKDTLAVIRDDDVTTTTTIDPTISTSEMTETTNQPKRIKKKIVKKRKIVRKKKKTTVRSISGPTDDEIEKSPHSQSMTESFNASIDENTRKTIAGMSHIAIEFVDSTNSTSKRIGNITSSTVNGNKVSLAQGENTNIRFVNDDFALGQDDNNISSPISSDAASVPSIEIDTVDVEPDKMGDESFVKSTNTNDTEAIVVELENEEAALHEQTDPVDEVTNVEIKTEILYLSEDINVDAIENEKNDDVNVPYNITSAEDATDQVDGNENCTVGSTDEDDDTKIDMIDAIVTVNETDVNDSSISSDLVSAFSESVIPNAATGGGEITFVNASEITKKDINDIQEPSFQFETNSTNGSSEASTPTTDPINLIKIEIDDLTKSHYSGYDDDDDDDDDDGDEVDSKECTVSELESTLESTALHTEPVKDNDSVEAIPDMKIARSKVHGIDNINLSKDDTTASPVSDSFNVIDLADGRTSAETEQIEGEDDEDDNNDGDVGMSTSKRISKEQSVSTSTEYIDAPLSILSPDTAGPTSPSPSPSPQDENDPEKFRVGASVETSISSEDREDSSHSVTSLEHTTSIADEVDIADLKKSKNHITVSVVTWNLAEESPSETDASFIKRFRKNDEIQHVGSSDIVLISGQECENIKPRRSEGSRSREFRRLMIMMLGKDYVPLALHLLGGIQFGLFCRRSILGDIEQASVADVTCGIGNVFHNKGAIGCFLQMKARRKGKLDTTKTLEKSVRMLFVTAHMAAHVRSTEARDSDFWRIVRELELKAPTHFLPKRDSLIETTGKVLLESADRIFFCGDLNYRLDLPREEVEYSISRILSLTASQKSESLAKADQIRQNLLKYDQLRASIALERAFPGFVEGKILFAPTFKFDKGTSEYDTSHKQRIPAWTDRVLFKPTGTFLLEYQSVETALHSDHRPVYATFLVDVSGRVRSVKTKRKRRSAKQYSNELADKR